MARLKREIYAIDSETDPFKYGRTPKPFSWGIYGEDVDTIIWGDDCTERFVEQLRDFPPSIMYAHNGGKFDFHFLLPYLDPELFIINGRIAKATLHDGLIEIRDSWLILPLSLASHDKGEIDYEKFEEEVREQYKSEIIAYQRRDCRSLYEWVINFRESFGGGLTLAGSAFKQLRKTDYPYSPTYETFDDLLRPFYFGGRVQCFKTGAFTGPLKYYDIKSAYPFAMKHEHWAGGAHRETLRLPDIENGSWFAMITARSAGALPYRFDEKLYFPDDGERREFLASGWEINTGLETGTLEIEKVHRVYRPLALADFTEYVEKFYAMKLGAEKEMANHAVGSAEWLYWSGKRQFAKLMLNSCYGKFGQDGRNYEKFMLCDFGDCPDDDLQWSYYGDTETLQTIYSRPDPVSRFYNVATAASITAFVRAYLWRHISSATDPLYCDTDSIICADFSGRLSDNLGDWECEAEIEEAYIAQRKMYALKTTSPKQPYKVASKGVRLDYEQIKRGVLTGKNIVTEKDAPAYSLKYGARFFSREVDFKNLQKNACNNPPLC